MTTSHTQESRTGRLAPPRSWKQPSRHFLDAVNHPWYRTLLETQDVITTATTGFWSSRGVKSLLLPVTTTAVSSPMGLGSDSLPVEVELGGERTYLADSMQFLLEYGCRFVDNGCYYVMPSFRGEETDRTHMSEFFHSEAELPLGLDDTLTAVDDYVRALCTALMTNCPQGVESVAGSTQHLESLAGGRTIERITFDEAEKLLPRLGSGVRVDPVHGFRNVDRAAEKALIDHVGGPVWLTHWDPLAVPFYQALDETGERTLNADLLMGEGEAAGAGERHVTGDAARAALQRHSVPEAEYEWYIAMKDEAPLRTSGFGIGIERFLLWVLNHDDVRDLQLLPRMRGSGMVP
ncbi:asparaginase [Streptomyces sp. SL13]|jgi:asparaginyl-tRNA synthetase|uniref:Asparaginase n=1 Tax=Streptantibioticus silvisoli TaxID=2705255 RepID=A0AA90GUB6_9ACTN|nr:amino acid--tRNA ligase-related protein [Streptantibioticus silvisoli]MDI5961597.1 asparaginase [Streptantibioticus silvisoli]MDI5968178.1 asparaginase [Streptantibioticus silvisoli]